MVPQGGREGVGAGERASGRVARVHRRAIEEEEMGVGGARPSLYICTLSKPRVLVMRNGAAWPLPSLLHWHCPPPRSISSRREGAPEAESSCARGRRQREAPPSHVWAKGKEGGLTLASGREIWQHRPSPESSCQKAQGTRCPSCPPASLAPTAQLSWPLSLPLNGRTLLQSLPTFVRSPFPSESVLLRPRCPDSSSCLSFNL